MSLVALSAASLVLLTVATFATWEIIEIWRHSSLLATWRARAELWEGFVGRLLQCPFCMSPWVGLLSILACSLPLLSPWPGWWNWVPPFVLAAFAVARLANLGNDLSHAWCRTPRHNKLDLPPVASPEAAEAPLSSEEPQPCVKPSAPGNSTPTTSRPKIKAYPRPHPRRRCSTRRWWRPSAPQ